MDAFAGTGTRSPSATSSEPFATMLGDLENADEDAEKFLDGSAKIALEIPSPFHKYLFIEESKKRAEALGSMVQHEFPQLADRVEIRAEDANKAICDWCQARDWTHERAVVFLDPYGMQVEWKTIESLAKTGGIDLWYLFPIVNRLLPLDGNIDESWRKKLDLLFGTSDWHPRFYQPHTQQGLFGPIDNLLRDATISNVQSFIQERLGTCFVKVAESRILRNSRQSPLFALCFAASNEKGANTAIKIAQYLLDM